MSESNGAEIILHDADVSIEPVGIGVIEATTRAEIDIQIATAQKYPRRIDRCLKQALTLATMDEDIAASMFYAVPRSGKTIEGPSVRLAETMACAWKNMRTQGRIVDVHDRHLTAEAVCIDLENNVGYKVEVSRGIVDRNGKRYNDDMIRVTGMAAISIAMRNAVLKVVPGSFTQKVYRAAREVAAGSADTLIDRRHAMLKYFESLGVKPKALYDRLGISGEEEITLDVLATIRGIATAIKDGDTTVEQAFGNPPPAQSEKVAARREMLNGKPPAESGPINITAEEIDSIFKGDK